MDYNPEALQAVGTAQTSTEELVVEKDQGQVIAEEVESEHPPSLEHTVPSDIVFFANVVAVNQAPHLSGVVSRIFF